MVLVENKVVIAVFDAYETKSNGKLINGCIFPMGDVVEIATPEEVVPQVYCYDTENGFYLNPNYKPVVDLESEVAQLKPDLALSQADTLSAFEALAEVYEMLLAMQTV